MEKAMWIFGQPSTQSWEGTYEIHDSVCVWEGAEMNGTQNGGDKKCSSLFYGVHIYILNEQ